jgi:hypothetical protein
MARNTVPDLQTQLESILSTVWEMDREWREDEGFIRKLRETRERDSLIRAARNSTNLS